MECYVRKHDKLVRHLDMCIEEVSREYARVTMPITCLLYTSPSPRDA